MYWSPKLISALYVLEWCYYQPHCFSPALIFDYIQGILKADSLSSRTLFRSFKVEEAGFFYLSQDTYALFLLFCFYLAVLSRF